MIVDEVSIIVVAGNGGNGCVSFRREKYNPKGGPDGGNGGKGADVYFVGVSDLTALHTFRSKKQIEAQNGGNGKSKKQNGKNADDLQVKVPIGTTVKNLDTGVSFDINSVNQKVLIARGGAGGIGNWELRSAQNQTPRQANPALPGERFHIHLNLQFIADIGLIGLPNAGKSSLLNVLTNAKAKIGDYPFTTTEPNLGNLDGKILADIPGLIDGASTGKGLGIKFLKHIEKTKLLIHCIDASSSDVLIQYHIIRSELDQYNPALLKKKEIIVLTKKDLVTEKELIKKIAILKTLSRQVYSVSIIDDISLNKLINILNKA